MKEAKTKKKEKPLPLKLAAGTTLHINRNYLTNYHFMLRTSLFYVLGFESTDGDEMLAHEVDGRGKLRLGVVSQLNDPKCERVFELWQKDTYENEIPHLRNADKKIAVITSKNASAKIAVRYLPLFERLAQISGGAWQVNTTDPARALRFVLNGAIEALLMPVKG